MDAIFVRGVHNRVNIDTELMDLFQTRGYAITDVPVIRVMEGYPMDNRAIIFSSIYELSGIISDCFRDTDIFRRAFIMIDDDLKVLYLMFTQTDDAEMPEIMDLVMETIGNA
jgi:Ca2+-binding EF-hand superfamily protein